MITLTQSDLKTLLPDATFIGDTFVFTGVATDSREVRSGMLFVTWTGEHCDGTLFAADAVKAGACVIMADKACDISVSQVITPDPIKALGIIARFWRERFDLPVVAVTGSNGKTTVKNMLRALLNEITDGHCLAPLKSFNNHVGVPLTLCQLNSSHRAAVIEMGMNHFGEIDYITQLAEPDVAAITNASPNHTEFVKDVKGVATAKAEIFNGLKPRGIAVLNADDDFADFWAERVAAFRVVKFGLTQPACVSAQAIRVNQNGLQFELVSPLGITSVTLGLLGLHNVKNALAACAVIVALSERFGWDVSSEQIAKGLAAVLPEPQRLVLKTSQHDNAVIDDTYNAGLASVLAAMAVLKAFSGKKVFVLGDIGELTQTQLETFYQRFADCAHAAGIQTVLTCGQSSYRFSRAFSGEAEHFADKADLLVYLKNIDASEKATFLIKGSRFMKMETVVEALV